MSDEIESIKPSGNTQPQPLLDHSPIIPISPQQTVGREVQANQTAKNENSPATRKELHILEKINIFGQLGLVIVGVIAASIYGCQLRTMNGQLSEMKGSGEQTKQLLSLYQQQLSQLSKQSADTHDLAGQAKNQADASKTIATNAVIQAKSTKELASNAGQQLSTMQTQLEISQRPWITVTSMTAAIIRWNYYPGGWSFNLNPEITYKNVGNIPAVKVYVASNLVFADQADQDFKSTIMKQQRDFCDRSLRNPFFSKLVNEQLVFPGKEAPKFQIGFGASLEPNQVRKTDGLVTPIVIGCVFYEFESSPTIHHTGFIYTLGRADQKPLIYGQLVEASEVSFSDAWNGVASIN